MFKDISEAYFLPMAHLAEFLVKRQVSATLLDLDGCQQGAACERIGHNIISRKVLCEVSMLGGCIQATVHN